MKVQLGIVTSAVGLLIVLGGHQLATAGVVYSEGFESPVVLESIAAGPATFVKTTDSAGGSNWQIQGGSGGNISVVGGIDANGVGASQSLFANWDQGPDDPAAHGYYTYNQYTVYGLPGMAAGTTLADVTVSLDLFIDGSSTNNPLTVLFQGTGGDRAYVPVLTNGQFTHVSFTLDQAAGGNPDLTGNFNLQVSHGAGGFGFDAGNIIRIDNVQVTNAAVPEPSTCVILTLGGLVLLAFRRR